MVQVKYFPRPVCSYGWLYDIFSWWNNGQNLLGLPLCSFFLLVLAWKVGSEVEGNSQSETISQQGWRIKLPSEDKCLVAPACPTLCSPMNCSTPGSSAHGIFQARILEWGAISSSRGSSRPRGWTHLLCLVHWQADSLPYCHMGSHCTLNHS